MALGRTSRYSFDGEYLDGTRSNFIVNREGEGRGYETPRTEDFMAAIHESDAFQV